MNAYNLKIRRLIGILKHFHSDAPNLREIALNCFYFTIDNLLARVLSPTAKLCAELDKTLIMFPIPTISFSNKHILLSNRRDHLWMGVLRSFFPMLAERRALKLDAGLCAYYYSTIHVLKVL